MASSTRPCAAMPAATRSLSIMLGLRDRETQRHSKRVVRLAVELGRCVGADADTLEAIGIGAAFHDVGKIGVPDQILHKQGRLDADEWAIMRRHPELSARILRTSGGPELDAAVRIVRHHHEHVDGSGYPDGLCGESIPLGSRVVAVADAYDAMAVTRPYRSGRGHTATLDIMWNEAGTVFDAGLLRAFAALIERSAFRAPSA